jgi:ketosteroid isomerase-like protein
MPSAKLHAANAGGRAEDVETAFYESLRQGDIQLLMACWSDDEDVICVHPGGPRLLGHGAIRSSFEAMFSNGTIRAQPTQVRSLMSLTSATHSVLEQIEVLTPDGTAFVHVMATNVYHKTAQGWKLVMHHASPGLEGEQWSHPGDRTQVLH